MNSTDPTQLRRPSRGAELGRSAETAWVLSRGGLPRLLAGRTRLDDPEMARELRAAAVALGPAYVKLAQIVASSPGLFPGTLSEAFGTLLDQVPPVEAEVVRRIVREEFGADPEVTFATFEAVPLASASIAQVHAVTLHDGRRAVVKIRRPGIRGRLAADVRLMQRLARLLERRSATGRMANPVAVVEDFAATLAQELDFLNEARAMETFAAHLRSSGLDTALRVPAVHWEHTTSRVLTMERMYGCRIDDIGALRAAGVDTAGLLRRGARAWLYGALVRGLFHGDVHAGNLLVEPDGTLAVIDFGIMGRLDERTREILCRLLPAMLLQGDFRAAAKLVYGLGAIGNPGDLEASAVEVAAFIKPLLGKPLNEISYGEILTEIVRIGVRYEFRLPRELVLFIKQLLYFERYAKLLAPGWSMLGDPELLAFLITSTTAEQEQRPGPLGEEDGPSEGPAAGTPD